MFDTVYQLLDTLAGIVQFIIIPAALLVSISKKAWSTLTGDGASKWSEMGSFVISSGVTALIIFVAAGVARNIVMALGTTAQSGLGF